LLDCKLLAVRIKAASDALGIPVPTLRRWTQEFAAGLSPSARASEGRPREFGPRDMRVLRRAKEILRDPDTTYERARRALSTEGLLSYEPEGDEVVVAPERDDVADREAAEKFVRDVVAREVVALREADGQLAQRVADLERQLRQLREELTSAVEAEPASGERRKGWFR
jgi:DNA-binding transcriptional MerR regulator